MDKINWANYSYDDFELFCNALLTFEIGKTYQPFSAPGKDGGIDGAYSGTYQNLTGSWRFQFKFFQVPRSEGVNNLRYQIKKEAAKVGNEEFFVLLTNVELLPQENKGLVEIFEKETAALNKRCTCFVWDGAKIFTLLLQYPILSLWLNEGFSTAQLQDYQTVFGRNLTATDFEPGSFSNFFISRETDIDNLHSFLDSDQIVSLIIGEAGIGKTRLVIEFFKQKVSKLENWTPLVLLNKHIDFDKIRKALSSDRNYVILIDDAHNYKPEVISDMKAVAESLKNRVKLLLTARTLEAFDALTLIKEYEANNFPLIKLEELSKVETEQVFRHYLEYTEYKHYTNELILTSFGKPILIVAMLNAIFNNIPINNIKEDAFLKKYVNNYFNSYIDKVNHLTGISKVCIKRLLQNIVLIEPFNFNDTALVDKLSELHDIKSQYIREALKLLVLNGFVNGRYEQSVKPDYYSDILLSEIDRNEVVRYITELPPYVNNIIINLSSVDEIDPQDNNILSQILSIYVKLIDSSNTIESVNKVLSTVNSISFVQPEIAKSAVELFVKCIAKQEHIISKNYKENSGLSYQPADTPLNKAISILSNLYVYPANIDFVFRNVLKLYTITDDKKLVNIFSFSKRDVIERFGMTRQSFIIGEFSKRLNKCTSKELNFALSCINTFLSLDFTLSDWNAVNRDSITITTYFIPVSTSVKKIRKMLIDLLIQLYEVTDSVDLRSEALKHILDVPRGIFATQKNTTTYNNDAEIKTVLAFLKNQANQFNILDQKEILEKLYWYRKWGISASLLPLVDEVKEGLKPKNLTEKLSQLFSKVEISILDMPNIEQFVSGKADEFVKIAGEEELADSIIAFLEPQQYPPHYYWHFQQALENNHPDYAKVLNDRMIKSSFKLYSMFGYNILGTMYFKHHDADFYWSRVKALQQLKTVEADNVLLAIYGQRVPGKTVLTGADIDVILKIFNKKKKENNYGLASALQNLFAAKDPQALQVWKNYLARAHQRETEMFFIRLSDNETVTEDQMADLILNDTVRYDLTYEIERCLNRVLIAKGIDEVFDYLLKRYEHKRNIVITNRTLSGYDFVPDGEHSHLFDNCPPHAKIEMFHKALDWYMTVDNEGGHLYYAKDLLGYLQPGQSLSKELAAHYQSLILQLNDDGEKLSRILDSLAVFHVKDNHLLQIVIDAYDTVIEFKEADEDLYKNLRTQAYLAITTMGVKSGAANSPFQVDLDLRDLLTIFINRLPEYAASNQFLKDVLKSVNADIDRSLDRENSTW